MKISPLIFSVFLIFASACKHSPFIDDSLDPGPGPIIDTSDCDPNTVYFQNEILPIFASNCAVPGCHDAISAQDGVLLIDYVSIVSTGDVNPNNPLNSDVYEVLIDTDPVDRMPPQGSGLSLTNDQITSIFDWIDQGALNNECQDLACDSVNVTFQNTISPIVDLYCIGCHGGVNPQGGISLSDYNAIKLKVDDGSFGGSINHQAGFVAMPFNQNQLPECEIYQINKWINDGAPNN